MSRNKAITCPQCGQSTPVVKISHLYIQSLSSQYLHGKQKQKWQEEEPSSADESIQLLSQQEIDQLSKRFAPPSGRSQRPGDYLHPDWLVTASALIAIYFFYEVIRAGSLPYIFTFAAIAVVAYGAYFHFRTKLIARYRAKIDAQVEEARLVEKAVGRWMKLYYCTHDQTVFDITSRQVIPLDEFKYYLFDLKK